GSVLCLAGWGRDLAKGTQGIVIVLVAVPGGIHLHVAAELRVERRCHVALRLSRRRDEERAHGECDCRPSHSSLLPEELNSFRGSQPRSRIRNSAREATNLINALSTSRTKIDSAANARE